MRQGCEVEYIIGEYRVDVFDIEDNIVYEMTH